MTNYRRWRQEGGTYFFTVVTHHRRNILTQEQSRLLLREAIQEIQRTRPFQIDAWVLLPEHLHCVWTLPEGDNDFSTRWSLIKGYFSKNAKELFYDKDSLSLSQLKKNEFGIWQRRFWEHLIRDEADFNRHVDYIHFNPMKHGLVTNARDWPYSTIHRYIEEGMYPGNWGEGLYSLHEDMDYE
ncbi:MAG: transposase [SAR324 cluster bacterium]|nr:transposase [SAR324 cluster bacterium]